MKNIFLVTITLVLFMSCPVNGQAGFHKIKSNHSVKGTVHKLTNTLNEKGMHIFATIDHQKGAEKAGLILLPTVLMIFGNPTVGTKLMQCDQKTGIALPLKMLIWQDEAGDTWIGYWEPSKLSERYQLGDCREILNKVKNAMANFANAAAS